MTTQVLVNVLIPMVVGTLTSAAFIRWWPVHWWPYNPQPKPKQHTGWEQAEDPPASEPYPTRRQCTMLVLTHHVWLSILREHATKADGTEHPMWHLHRQIEQCETTLQMAEILARSWFESALSITTCGYPTGAPYHVLGMLSRVHGEDKAIGARAIVAETAEMVRTRLNYSGFSVPLPDQPHEVLEKVEQLAVASLRREELPSSSKSG